MEIREGTIPLVTLAIIFLGLQAWWIGTVLINGRAPKKYVGIRRATKTMPKDQLKIQKKKLEDLLKK